VMPSELGGGGAGETGMAEPLIENITRE